MKKNNKTKRGGAGCNAQCSTNANCTDSECPQCVNGQCTGSSLVAQGTQGTQSAEEGEARAWR